MSAMARLVSAIDDAIAAQQDVIRQLVRAKAEIVRLYDQADIEAGRAPSARWTPRLHTPDDHTLLADAAICLECNPDGAR